MSKARTMKEVKLAEIERVVGKVTFPAKPRVLMIRLRLSEVGYGKPAADAIRRIADHVEKEMTSPEVRCNGLTGSVFYQMVDVDDDKPIKMEV